MLASSDGSPTLVAGAAESAEHEMVIEMCQVEIPVQSALSHIEVFQESDFSMTLKRYLSTQDSINAVLGLFELASDDEQTLKCLRLLACITI